ncbi:hypothetical protein N7516_007312 [Penicillium verrucosum]|uniref:uncharacterized protein n=1 Tax=Penicillium psychrosexuale TaxID=1002107 RepID=UPI0025459723|nr:uncharacterized protein N7518_009101 [Penicillium psychrosexuale]XP_057074123.1 uncharacterized protein N7516_007312 [Penicillium verrucosum]KAJ5783424.1 hypothetical protein N7518_009101 [Penicillium psychrosexuale]KAJ5932823.1 hypothetical protein N7516_007312 [Penicillium verrucosum]
MSEQQIVPHSAGRQLPRPQFSVAVSQILACLTCIQANVADWIRTGTQYGFGPRFTFRCLQDSGESNDCQRCHQTGTACERVPTGIEGHLYELLALIAWLNLMWGSYDPTNAFSDAFVPTWLLPSPFLAELGDEIRRLCSSFRLLARNHIFEHGIHPGCSRSRRTRYRNWLLHRQPLPSSVELDGSPEAFAEFSMSKHKSTGTEDHVYHWYGAVVSFRRRVIEIVDEGTLYSAHEAEYADRLNRFPAQILPVELRGLGLRSSRSAH